MEESNQASFRLWKMGEDFQDVTSVFNVKDEWREQVGQKKELRAREGVRGLG